MMDLSIVVPLFNEEESLAELTAWIEKVCRHKYAFEILFVDDGSSDSSWEIINTLASTKDFVRAIRFRRNYGKAAALHCGFQKARGKVVVTMDADMQDSPEEIPELFKMIEEEDFDMVSGWKKKRYDPLSKRIPSKFYNFTARKATGIKLHDFNCGLKAYKLDVVQSIEVYGEMHRYIPMLAKQAGFRNIGEKVVRHHPRKYGKTKYGMKRFITGYLDLLTITFLSRFAKRPMHLFGSLGTFMFLLGFAMAVVVGANKLIHLRQGELTKLVTDSPYFYIGLTSMILGTLLFLAGFLGELISRNAPERNTYLIKETLKIEGDN